MLGQLGCLLSFYDLNFATTGTSAHQYNNSEYGRLTVLHINMSMIDKMAQQLV